MNIIIMGYSSICVSQMSTTLAVYAPNWLVVYDLASYGLSKKVRFYNSESTTTSHRADLYWESVSTSL